MDAVSTKNDGGYASEKIEKSGLYSISAVTTMANLGFMFTKGSGTTDEAGLPVGEVLVGDLTPLERAVMQSRNNFKKLELAQASIDGVKVEGIDTNVAVMKVCCLLSKFRPFKLSFSSNCLCIDITCNPYNIVTNSKHITLILS